MNKNSILGLALVLILSGCMSPQLKKWEGNKFTLCCPQHACKAEKWQETVAARCAGKAKQTGSEMVEKVDGYDSVGDAQFGASGVNTRQSVRANKSYEECRSYECAGTIRN